MDRIKKGDGQVTTQQEIIKEQVRFYCDRCRKTVKIYSNRYRKTVNVQELSTRAFLDGIDIPQLNSGISRQ